MTLATRWRSSIAWRSCPSKPVLTLWRQVTQDCIRGIHNVTMYDHPAPSPAACGRTTCTHVVEESICLCFAGRRRMGLATSPGVDMTTIPEHATHPAPQGPVDKKTQGKPCHPGRHWDIQRALRGRHPTSSQPPMLHCNAEAGPSRGRQQQQQIGEFVRDGRHGSAPALQQDFSGRGRGGP